jgi:hypothetical protein
MVVLAVAGMAMFLGSCAEPADRVSAEPADRVNMSVPVAPALSMPCRAGMLGAIAVASIDGGQETNLVWRSEVGNDGFRGALVESLRNNGLLAEGMAPSLILHAHLIELRRPPSGLRITVSAKVDYEIVDALNGHPARSRTVESEYTAAFEDAFSADERIRFASEGAIRENIRNLLEWLCHGGPRVPGEVGEDARSSADGGLSAAC